MLYKIKIEIYRIIAIVFLGSVYLFVCLISLLFHKKKNISLDKESCILLIGTFHNPNWFVSHVTPLSKLKINKVIVVCDSPVVQLPNVQFACPPTALSKLFGRALSKFLWAIIYSFRSKPNLYMGYHIFPAATSALILGKLFNKPSCYQNTSGAVELAGGGWMAANSILRKLSRPSPFIEYLVNKIVCSFDLIVVRGTKAKKYIRELGYNGNISIITGSLAYHSMKKSFDERSIDIIFVGRLSETKRADMIIPIVKQIVEVKSSVLSVLIGEGDMRSAIESKILSNNLEKNIKLYGQRSNILDQLIKSKVFILTSRSEGLSIAMIEAMSTGTVPVVSDVGDLGDIVKNGVNGFLIDKNDIDSFSNCIIKLIDNNKLWERCSSSSIQDSYRYSGIDVIVKKWSNCLSII